MPEVKRIRIKEALEYKEKQYGWTYYMNQLAEMVITDRLSRDGKTQISDNQKKSLMSLYNSGKKVNGKRKKCPDNYLAKISKLTGVTTDYLIGLTDSPTSKI